MRNMLMTLILFVVGVIAVIGLGVFAFYINPILTDDCINYDNKIGYLNGMENEFRLIIDNESWYVSDYFYPDGGMPSDFSKYFGHNVNIRYAWGCGRVMIENVKILNERK